MELRVTESVMARWRRRFTERRCDGLTDEPRSGRPPVMPMMPSLPERRTHDYARNGITSLFAAFNIADGILISALHRRHRHMSS